MFYFYFPKVIIALMIWITFYGYVFSEGLVILHRHLVTNDFNPDSFGLKLIEVILKSHNYLYKFFYYITMAIYIIYAAFYGIRSMRKAFLFQDSRFAVFASCQSVLSSFLIISLLVMPFENKTMRFVSENAFVNLYMLMLSTLMKVEEGAPENSQYVQ